MADFAEKSYISAYLTFGLGLLSSGDNDPWPFYAPSAVRLLLVKALDATIAPSGITVFCYG
ncbi:hypothetical protein AB6825_00170 [Serratia proteamaculans]|jgi:hypothetical protein|uniref:hypothetical protein n=1 Tax=Serratia proteamaculans TaxID=28151 RepID=UPI0021BB5D11|nr:hypothetical protein [Serratia proteamaculans]